MPTWLRGPVFSKHCIFGFLYLDTGIREGSSVLRSLVVEEDRRRPGMIYHGWDQCFQTIGWVTVRASSM